MKNQGMNREPHEIRERGRKPEPCPKANLKLATWNQQLRRGFQLVLLFLFGVLAALPVAAQYPACTAARFLDWKDLGCRIRGPGLPDLQCPPCDPTGMPHWSVSEPFLNVWVRDEPLSYPLSHGERMTFRWSHRQRYEVPPVYSYFHLYTGLTNGAGRDTASYRAMRTFGATNAAWQQNWLSDIVFWDYSWETSWWLNLGVPTPPAWVPFSGAYEAFWYRAEGGVMYLNPPATTSDPATRIRFEPLGALGRPVVTSPVADPNGIFWGGSQTNGFRVIYPDGAQDIHGLTLYVYGNPANAPNRFTTARAFLTQRIDAQGRVTRIGYQNEVRTNLQGAVLQFGLRIRYVVDSDGRTNTYSYGPNDIFHVTQVQDPYGREARLEYGAGYGPTKLIDAANLTNSVAYQSGTSGWLSSYTTPYGMTSFEYHDQLEAGYPEKFYRQRAVRITEPDGSKQLFLYHHKTDFSTPASVSPAPSVAAWTFDDGNTGGNHQQLYHRNSFHWNTRQYAALVAQVGSSSSLSTQLGWLDGQSNAYRLARLQHWLLGNDLITATGVLSAEREGSLDAGGTQPGAWSFHAYGNSGNPELEPADPLVTCQARLLPDGNTWFTAAEWILPTTGWPMLQRESYTQTNGSVGTRLRFDTYSPDGLRLLTASATGGQSVKLTWNTNQQVTHVTNSLNQVTTFTYDDTTRELTSVTNVGGQTAALTYYPSNATTMNGGFLKTLQWNPGPTWTFGYEKGLIKAATNDAGLWLTFTWDDLLRPTGTTFPDGTYTSNRFHRLDLVASRDRLGNWTTAGYDALQRPTAITNANNAVTRLDWCGCGALNSITDALTNTTFFYYNNQGVLTNQVYADGSSVKYFFDAAGRMTNLVDGLNRSIKLSYNNQGLLTTVSNAFGPLESIVYDALDRPHQITDANNVTVTNTFDLLNRLTARVWPDGFGETYGWSTNGLIAHTNRAGQITRFTRDTAGRLTAVTNANLEVTRVLYNTRSQITDLWDGLNQHTSWTFDEYGRRRSKTDALGRPAFQWDYNANGWLTNRTMPQSGHTRYFYDALGNLTNRVALDFSLQPIEAVSYAYNALNQLTSMVDGLGATKFSYTQTGQLQTEDGPWTDDTVTLSYVEGLRTAMSVGSAWAQSYGYDSAWRMTDGSPLFSVEPQN